jgi:galactonate dehydratase
MRDRVRLHALVFADDPDQLARLCRAAVDEGFSAVKFDPLQPGYQDQSLARLIEGARDMAAAAREAVGLDVDIIFELHRKLTPMTSVPVAAALAEFRPLFVEDPIQIDSIDLQGGLAQRFSSPLANGERLDTIWEFRDLLARGAQHVRPDVGQAGGLTGCKKIAALAEAHHAALVSHNYLSPLLTAASVHLAITIPNFITQEYHLLDESDHPGAKLFSSAVRREGGYVLVPETPGLGVEMDETWLELAPPAEHGMDAGLYRADGSPAYAG